MFYDNLKPICDKQKIKITPLVEECGGTKGMISGWKKGASPNSEIVMKLSKRLNVTTDYLLFGEEGQAQTIINSNNNVSEGSSQRNIYTQGGELTDEFEKELIKEYRSLSIKNKRKIFDYIDKLKEESEA